MKKIRISGGDTAQTRKWEAIKVIKDIQGETDPEDKLTAIQEITCMETINSVTKQDLVEALRWLVEEYI